MCNMQSTSEQKTETCNAPRFLLIREVFFHMLHLYFLTSEITFILMQIEQITKRKER